MRRQGRGISGCGFAARPRVSRQQAPDPPWPGSDIRLPDFPGVGVSSSPLLKVVGEAVAMILVTGSILAREDSFDEVLRLSLEHVARSRKEPGCISHDVHVDCQNPRRLFFF